jgi:hypothetical protein
VFGLILPVVLAPFGGESLAGLTLAGCAGADAGEASDVGAFAGALAGGLAGFTFGAM